MGRPRIKQIDLQLVRLLRKLGLDWHTIERHYYTETKQEVSFMTLKRRYMEAVLALAQEQSAHNDHNHRNHRNVTLAVFPNVMLR